MEGIPMKKTRKILSVLLVLIMIISIIPLSSITASAATSGTCGDNLTWAYNVSNRTLTISGTGAMYDYSTNNRPWEVYEDDIGTIIIDDNVTTIGDYAFYDCNYLVMVSISDSVTTIGGRAFARCESLSSISIGDGVTTIGDAAFSCCIAFTRITLPNGLITIGRDAFAFCKNLISVDIPNSVATIGDYAFSYCINLAVLTIGYGVTIIGDYAFDYCSSLKNVYYIGAEEDWNEILIGTGNEYLTGATIELAGFSGPCGENLTWEFDKLTGTLTISGTGAMDDFSSYSRPWFSYEDSIKTIIIGNGVTTIGKYSFEYCQCLTDVYYDGSDEGWDDIFIGANNKYLNSATIHFASFSGACGDDLTWSYNTATYTLTISGTGAMYDYSTNDIPWRKHKDNVKTIVIGDGVTAIDEGAFGKCWNLTNISVDSNNQYYSNDDYGVLFNKEKTILIQYPVGDTRTFYTIPDSVTVIGYGAFGGCYCLTSIIIDENLIEIDDEAFFGCYSLTNITIPDGVTTIGKNVFWECDSLTSVTIPDSVTTMGGGTFFDCDSLISVTIGDDVTIIGECAFMECDSLTRFTIGDSVTTIGEYAFMNCDSLTSVTFGDSVTTVSMEAFIGCDSLTSVIIPNSVKVIDTAAFYSCPNIMHVYYNGTKEEWGKIVVGEGNEDLLNANIHFIYCEHNHGHTYEDNYIPATCTQPGSKDIVTHCDACDTDIERETIVIEALGHAYDSVLTAPTCEDKGYTTYTCSKCDDSYVENYIDELGHTPASAVEENYAAPTCTEKGSKDVVVYCSVCKEEISRETIAIDATGHVDNDGDGYCDEDNEPLTPIVECSCNCHKSGISKFFFNLILFFNKLFGSNKECACGIAHY